MISGRSPGAGARLLLPLLLFALGAAAMFAGARGLYANVVLALLLAGWAWGAILVRARREARVPGAPAALPDLLAEQAREQRRLVAYLNLSPAPLVTLDGEGRLHAVNRAARRLFGCEDLLPEPPAGLGEAIEAATPGRSAGVRLTIDGIEHDFALAIADLTSGGAGTRIAALVDIGAELRAAEAGALRDLLQVLSHEIMNALTPIASLGRTAADLLAERAEPDLEPARDAVETVARRAEGLQRFTSAYRDLAKLPPPDIRRVELRSLLGDLGRMLAARWPDVAFDCDLERAPRQVRADPDQLSAAVWALLQNAAEALDGRADPRITLDAEAIVGGVRIRVGDNGPGVPEAHRAAIFRPFYTTRGEGSGVGLALVRQIMHAHQGSATCDSNAQGACFTLAWPGR